MGLRIKLNLFFALHLISISLFAQQGGVEKIIFASVRGSTSLDPSLYMMNLDGSNITRIKDSILGDSPRISHDGKRIAYTGWDPLHSTLNKNVHVLNLETKEDKIVSLFKQKDGSYLISGNDCYAPLWSPDDSFIVYTDFGHWTPTVIFKVKSDTLDGFERYLLTPHPYGETATDWVSNWNILYSTRFFEDSLYNFNNYFTMDSHGNNRHRLTNFTQLFKDARYSPDGKRIAFLMKQGDQFDIFIMNNDGTNVREITNIGIKSSRVESLSWSPDGEKIVFDTNEQIYIVDVETKEITQITNDNYKNFTPEWAVVYPTNVKESQSKIVEAFELLQNYPNPFNPETTINYTLPESGNVQVKIFDVLGRELKTLVNEYSVSGLHSVKWDGSNYSSGVYFCSITFNGKTLNNKMLMMK